ncbi:hypothetical protein BC830DRAFT_1171291 [Chytriomyces sp. MP71]|nr:hypothetical protein BC830DRAFT_1171291 [Chytriomyces sp. MP71]
MTADNPDPTNLRATIEQLAQLDLHTPDEAFAEWLRRKRANARPNVSPHLAFAGPGVARARAHASCATSRTATPAPSPSIAAAPKPRSAVGVHARFEAPTPIPVATKSETHERQKRFDEMLRKKARSQKAFLAWLERKEETRIVEEGRAVRKAQAKAEEEERERTRQEAKAQRVKAALEQWQHEKQEEEARQRALELERQQQREQEERAKQERAKEAFKAWRERVDKEAHTNPTPKTPFASHSHRWIDIMPTAAHLVGSAHLAEQPKKNKLGYPHSKLEVLSPPNLYKDYSLYQTMAPSYIIKYPSQVASGGVGLSLSYFNPNAQTTSPTSKMSAPAKPREAPLASRPRARTNSVKPKLEGPKTRSASAQAGTQKPFVSTVKVKN